MAHTPALRRTPEVPVPVYALGDRIPSIDPTAFVHPDAVVIGDVTIGPESTVWPTAVLRGDHGRIVVGAQTSVQDGTVVHCTADTSTPIIGDRCVVGHNAHLEGCTIEDDCLVGSGSVVLHRVVVRRGALVGATAMVRQRHRGARPCHGPRRPREDPPGRRRPRGRSTHAVAKYVHNGHWYRADLRASTDGATGGRGPTRCCCRRADSR